MILCVDYSAHNRSIHTDFFLESVCGMRKSIRMNVACNKKKINNKLNNITWDLMNF